MKISYTVHMSSGLKVTQVANVSVKSSYNWLAHLMILRKIFFCLLSSFSDTISLLILSDYKLLPLGSQITSKHSHPLPTGICFWSLWHSALLTSSSYTLYLSPMMFCSPLLSPSPSPDGISFSSYWLVELMALVLKELNSVNNQWA